MSLRLRVYGGQDNPAMSYDNNGRYVDFDTFEAVTDEARAAATSCVFSTLVVVNGHRLGTQMSPICDTVQVNATGDRVEFTAPTVEIALAVWNNHAGGIDEWLRETMRPVAAGGVWIRVYGPATNELLTNVIDSGRAYAEFNELDAVPSELLEGFTYTVGSAAPRNSYQLGAYPIRFEPSVPFDCSHDHGADDQVRCMTETVDAEVAATATHIAVRSTSLNFAVRAWGMYLEAVAPGSQYAQEANLKFIQLRDNAKQA